MQAVYCIRKKETDSAKTEGTFSSDNPVNLRERDENAILFGKYFVKRMRV